MDSAHYIDPTYRGPTLIRGYLKKLKSDHAYAKFLSKFTKRYFIADLNNYYFGYQDKETSSKLQKHSITELINIDPNPRITEICDWKFAFVVEFGKRIYTLYADSVSVHNEWCYALKACLKPFEKVRNGEMSVPQMISTVVRNEEEEVKQRNPSPEGFNTGEGLEGVESNVRIHKEYEVKEEYRQGANYVSGEQLAHSRVVELNGEVIKDQQRRKEESSGAFNYKSEPNVQEPRKEIYNEEAARPVAQNRPKENEGLKSGPKLEVIRSDYQQEVHQVPKIVRAKNYSDDEEISLVSGPKSDKKENDELKGFIPIVQVREKPQNYKPEAKPEVKPQIKPEITLASDPNIVKGFRPTPAKSVEVSFKPSSIIDMMSEMDNLGLENVEIRPVNTIRGKILSESKNTTKANNELFTNITEKPPVFVDEINRATESRPQMKEMKNREEPRSSNWETFEKPVAEKKNLTVKPVVKIALKPKYVEKPEIKPDEDTVKPPAAQVTSKPVTSSIKPKEKAVFKESNPQIVSQGKDMDWDDWDD